MKKILLCVLLWFATMVSGMSAEISVTMNATSRTMTLQNKTTLANVDVGEPQSNYKYTFTVEPGEYRLTAYATDNSTINGTIDFIVTDEADQNFKIFTITTYATNSGWVYGTDYTITHQVVSREGEDKTGTIGSSTTAGRSTFLAFEGNTFYLSLIPSTEHQNEGYMTLTRSATITGNTNSTGAIPMGYTHTITIPETATLFLGTKTAHYIKFNQVSHDSVKVEAGKSIYYFRLAAGQVYNYRVSQTGKLTQGGYFTMNANENQRPQIEITQADLDAHNPKTVDHDVNSNSGYNVGDIFLNINERGHLKMNVGDNHQMIACRTWQLTDNSTNNYFIEPDFHYTVVNANGEPDNSVITIDDNQKITAVGNGTAIVLVTYDAINLNFYSGVNKTPYLGGPFWAAIWPENTGTFVVTVGDAPSNIVPNIKINEAYNENTKKLAGEAVDAEHDVFYYLPSDNGFNYTFTPENVNSVTIAYPSFGENISSYSGFGTNGVTANADGSYTVTLKQGRNIVKMTNAEGVSDYQIFTAKPTNYVISNGTNPGEPFQPGDQIKVQYSGLFHPANKLAGIYNMSGYVTYNNIPNGSSLILGSGQYTFASAQSAQLYTVVIPDDWDVDSSSVFSFSDGVIQVNGYGDPIGNHRNTSPIFGRNPNFTAIAHKTYFGALPSISVNIQPTEYHWVKFENQPNSAIITVLNSNNDTIKIDSNGYFKQTFGKYNYTIVCDGYKTLRSYYSISSNSPDTALIAIDMEQIPSNGWDGITTSKPTRVSTEESNTVGGIFEGMEGYYKISSGFELAWFSNYINSGTYDSCAVLVNSIDLCNFEWTPIGKTSAATAFKGVFEGAEHTIDGLYINAKTTYRGLFGYISNASIRNLTVKGEVTSTANYTAGIVAYAASSTIENCHNMVVVSGKQYTAGIVSYANTSATINHCSNMAPIYGSSSYASGICGYLNSNDSISNCFNIGNITGNTYAAAIVGGVKTNTLSDIYNCYNTGEISTITSTVYIGAIKGNPNYGTIHNSYSTAIYSESDTIVKVKTAEQFALGEVAWLLGDAFGQEIGEQLFPIFNGLNVYKVNYTNNLDSLTNSLFTNGSLPYIVKDNKYGTWLTNIDGNTISSITSDCSLFLMFDIYTSEFSESACGSFTWNEQTYTTSGDYVQNFTTVHGCDSTVTLHLTVYQPAETEFAESACGSFTWNEQTYTTSGDFVQNFTTVHGCDSTVTLHLTVNQSNLVEIADSVLQGEPYTLNGFNITSDQTQEVGTFEFTLDLQNQYGCDSTIVLSLTVLAPNAISSTTINNINMFPNPTHNTLYINGLNGYTHYQIISSIGNVVDEGRIADSNIMVSTSAFGNGIYFVRLYGNGACTIKKFIVKH